MKQESIIIAYHLRPGMRFWDEFYGKSLTVLDNEYEPRGNKSIIRVREIPHTLSMDAITFVPLREPAEGL